MRITLDKDGLRQGLAMSTVMLTAMGAYTLSTSPYRFWALMGALMLIQQRYNEPFRDRLPVLLYSGGAALVIAVPFTLLGQLSWWWFAGGLGVLAFVGMWLGAVWRLWQGVTTSVLLIALFAGALTPLFLGDGGRVNVWALELWLLVGIGLAISFAWLWDTLIPRRNFPRQALLVFQEIQQALGPVECFFAIPSPRGDAAGLACESVSGTTIYTRVAELTTELPIISKGYALGTCPLASSTLRMGRWLSTLAEALARIPDKALVEQAVPGAGDLARTISQGVAHVVERLEDSGNGWAAANRTAAAAERRSPAMERIRNEQLARMDWSAALAVVEVAFCLEQLSHDLRKAEQRLEEVLP